MPASSPPAERGGFDWLLAAAVLAMAATFIRAIYFTPVEALQGAAQKIFYIHAPSAFIGLYVAFGIVAVAGGLYLWLRDERLDRVAASAAEVGVVFMTVVLITGPMWGKPIWGAWWTWDARLTLTLFIWFVFVGYLILRGAIEIPRCAPATRRCSVLLGALLVPFIHLSVYLFRTLHPMPIVSSRAGRRCRRHADDVPDVVSRVRYCCSPRWFVCDTDWRSQKDALADEELSESPAMSLRRSRCADA
jgi:heme exporter protein C